MTSSTTPGPPPPLPPAAARPGVTYATFTQRAIGLVADTGLLAVVSSALRLLVLLPYAVTAYDRVMPIYDQVVRTGTLPSQQQIDAALPALGMLAAVTVTTSLLVNLAYFTYAEHRTGRTVGKSATSIRVLDADTGLPISLWQALGRSAAKYLSFGLFGIGVLWMLHHPRNQTWHDLLASTIVVHEDPTVTPSTPPTPSSPTPRPEVPT